MTMNRMLNSSTIALALTDSAIARISTDASNSAGNLSTGGPFNRRTKLNDLVTVQEHAEKTPPLYKGELQTSSESGISPDVGILREGISRTLQHGSIHYSEGDHHDGSMMCGANCQPSTCVCMSNIFLETSGVDCAIEIDAVCNGVTDVDGTNWNIQGCIVGYPYGDSSDILCSVAKCRVDGGSFATCWSQPFNAQQPSVDASQEVPANQTPISEGFLIESDCCIGAKFSLAAAAVLSFVFN